MLEQSGILKIFALIHVLNEQLLVFYQGAQRYTLLTNSPQTTLFILYIVINVVQYAYHSSSS